MDEFSPHSFANRDSPIPLIRFNDQASVGNEHDVGPTTKKQMAGRATEKKPSMQDRLLEKLLQQVIPTEDQARSADTSHFPDLIEPPSFSLPTMSTNFRRFNARCGVLFVFQARMIRLFSWRTYSHTISLLFVYTFICLDPSLLAVVPLAAFLLGIFIPSFLARHPAPPITLSTSFEYSPRGPPIAPAPTVKPVKELSKDFFRNMRDLQNSMEDFSQLHDHIIATLSPPTNFSNESLSSALFIVLFLSTAAMFIASHLLPWRLLFLLGGWLLICSGHPSISALLSSTHDAQIAPRGASLTSWLDAFIDSDILLDSEPETREVEVFELQNMSGAGEWEPWLFSASPYDPLSPARIADERPRGTRFFEDVRPPQGWEWSEKKWTLDLWSREWVEERIITGVEVETGGERWVYDIHYEEEEARHGVREAGKEKASEKGKMNAKPTWEEGIEGQGRKGQWRRRRWVRLVKRRVVTKSPGET